MEFKFIPNPENAYQQEGRLLEQALLRATLHGADPEIITRLTGLRDQVFEQVAKAPQPEPTPDSRIVEVAKELADYKPEDFDTYEQFVNALESRRVDLTQLFDDVPTEEIVVRDRVEEIWPTVEEEVTPTLWQRITGGA